MMTNCVVSFEVRTTISCNSRLASHHFSCAISDHFINSIGINIKNRKAKVDQMKTQVNNPSRIVISILAVTATLMALMILLLGEDILQTLESIYPSWAFPVYFIPWFLLFISSVQKLNKHKKEHGLQVWVLKITFPLFLFTLPFFSHLLSAVNTSSHCINDCQVNQGILLGLEPYCMFFAIISLFLLFTLPSKWLHNK